MEPVLNRLYGLLFTAVLLATPASGDPPVIATPHTATICNLSGCLMIPGYTVSDPEEDTLTYSYSATAALAGADIDPNTGQITATTALGDVTFDLTVTDSHSETDTKTITLTTFPDANPPTISGTFTASVAESAVVGTTVTTSYTASGGDTGDGVTYAISGTDVAFFKIGLFDGVLTTDATLDYETKSSLSVELTVKDSKRTASSPQALTITVTDIPACNPNTIDKKMTKGATAGTVVTTLSCSDAGATLSYAITAGNTNTDFGISTAAGVMTVLKPLDEVTVHDIKVTVTSGTETAIVDVKVTVSASASDTINKASRLYIVAGLILLMKYHFE